MILKVIKTFIVLCIEYCVGYIMALIGVIGVSRIFAKIWPDVFENN